ncbi:hypothetical protein QBA54_12245 [Streptomyces sp. B21-108]|uniref:hypothetical protein n=1 Tax=Streptomyces sp. B21-108 TaxID=3039419 RepID=UPI002FF3638F
MTVSIIHALLRWILGVFVPGTGRRRAVAQPAAPTLTRVPDGARALVVRLPAPRSPYGLSDLLDGASTVPVRPYVLAAERAHKEGGCEQARQTRRGVTLLVASDFGMDLDRQVIGAERVA